MEPSTKDGITIRIMTLADYGTFKHLFEEQFINGEPLFGAIKGPIDPEIWNLYDQYHESMVNAGTCVVAIDEQNEGRVVGFVLAEGQTIDDVENHRLEAESIPETDIVGHIRRILCKVEAEANIYQRYGVTKLLYSHLTSVDVSMRGKGLGTRLATSAMELGRSKGFTLMTAFCSSFYSARQKEALGMECICSMKYEDYKDSEGKVVFTPPAPHKEIRVLAMKI
ncbi:dopamine N-acetyltransferase-like [Drosophila guanche]|uniref:aralkylamine N-acetyltransferase n=1 Tax=Drosophila guanche TaxID=7266 RepID=A0A3B0JVQ0_DROGU|nr:dopamine N-acetyltransferase-like [Drosophila guanche]SPP86144.1 blast:Dopamine N-acetyltransferase [Drosophila guanche]